MLILAAMNTEWDATAVYRRNFKHLF